MSVIIDAARTPMGKFLGALREFSAVELGAIAIRGALSRSGLDPAQVDYVIMGQVLQAGAGQMSARQAAVGAGIGLNVPAATINKVCLSGINSIMMADQLIATGQAEIVVAGGMESMTQAPHLLTGSRSGIKYGHWAVQDSMMQDGLICALDNLSMGEATERYNESYSITRAAQDAFALQSQHRASKAQLAGLFMPEIVSVPVRLASGEVVEITQDEGIRSGLTIEALEKLRPAFAPDGTITAGSSSIISDGAAAVIVVSEAKAKELGLIPIAQIISSASVAGPDTSLHLQPANAITAACAKLDLAPDCLDLYEINEAFAAVALASINHIGLDPERVNVNGGAIALGHPLGMSGTRLVMHLAMELQRRGGGIGAAALCGGGGQGDAIVLRTPN